MKDSSNFIYLNVECRRGVKDVGGWNPEKFGVSVAAALVDARLHLFTEENIAELVPLLKTAKAVVGYNLQGFDFRILSGYPEVDLSGLPYLDLLASIEMIVGFRVSLTETEIPTFGVARNADFQEVRDLWKNGNVMPLTEYCCNTVLAIKRLHEYGMKNGCIYYNPPESNRREKISVDWDNDRCTEQA